MLPPSRNPPITTPLRVYPIQTVREIHDRVGWKIKWQNPRPTPNNCEEGNQTIIVEFYRFQTVRFDIGFGFVLRDRRVQSGFIQRPFVPPASYLYDSRQIRFGYVKAGQPHDSGFFETALYNVRKLLVELYSKKIYLDSLCRN